MTETHGAPSRSIRITRALTGHRRELNNGFGNALNNAVELSVTPAIFGFIGWRIDAALGTSPVFFVSLFILVVSSVAWKLMSRYDQDMRAQEQRFRPRTGNGNR